MAIVLPDARQLSDDILQALRLRALRGCELGFTETDLANLLGVSRETICRWWTSFATGGLEALPHDRTGRPVGTGRTLTAEQGRRLQERIDGHAPEECGIASPLWTRRAVRDLIHHEYGIAMPIRTVGEYLRRWGYTAKKPQRHFRKQDPAEVRQWLEQTYPALARRAAQEQAEIHWCDETGIAADQHLGCGYARVGQPATVEVPDAHVRMNMVSSLSASGKLRFMTYAGTMTSAVFIVFLERLLRSTVGKIFLMVDRLQVHVSGAVADWAAKHQDRIELFELPRHAPELNPVEYLNNDVKGNVNKEHLPESKATLRSQLQGFMHRLQNIPEHIMNLFSHPKIQYAAVGA